MSDTYDILISGGGLAGLTAAAAFGTAGFRVLCADPARPVTGRDEEGADLRSTALLQPARSLLEEAGVWPHLASYATPLQVMQMVDAGGADAQPRVTCAFDASDISDQPFGWNFPNWLLRRELIARLADLPNVSLRLGTGTTSLFTRSGGARVGLSDGSRVRAALVIAADGRASPMRAAAGIGATTTRYGQKALAFAVTHPIPHQNVSTEIHRTGGPFTLVPLPDHEGLPSSAVVWMERGPKAAELLNMAPDDFEAEMSARACYLFGPLKLASRRMIWPIISQQADRLTGERLALMAEAAHVVPPIGAQGLNMSLADLRALLDLARAHPEDPGTADVLDAYARARRSDIRLRVAGIDMLNRASMAGAPMLRDARALGLDALHRITPVRHGLMRMGLGAV